MKESTMIRGQLRDTRAIMKMQHRIAGGIRHGGHSRESMRLNERMFMLETRLKVALNKEKHATIKSRLEYLRGEIRAERLSYGEISELHSLVPFIDKNDVELLEWAGVPEGTA